jgi:hypothetical protein
MPEFASRTPKPAISPLPVALELASNPEYRPRGVVRLDRRRDSVCFSGSFPATSIPSISPGASVHVDRLHLEGTQKIGCRSDISRNLCNLRNRSPLKQSVLAVGLYLISPDLPRNAEALFGPSRAPAYRLGFPFLARGFRLCQDALRQM